MRIKLSEKTSEEMFFVSCKSGDIHSIDVTRKSQSGSTVETASGQRYRTDTKAHKIFYSYDFALIARKRILGPLDDEYRQLLADNGLREAS